MLTPPFEIRVALLGFVSVGKTTVLNALLRDKFGEVSMRRTTAGVNFFRLVSRNGKRKAEDLGEERKSSHGSGGDAMDWSVVAEDNRDAQKTLKQITEDNASFRESEEIHEKSFDIVAEEELCEMRDDTRLVLIDIPGVNEAGVGAKYKDYVQNKWDTFDCVIVVMDGRQGVNTAEQVELLEFVRKNNVEKKDVPIIILCNKVDDPDDEEQAVLVTEARKEVERVFQVADRSEVLDRVLNSPSRKPLRSNKDLYPVFIPTSAIHAFIYQTASLMSLDQFKRFDKDLVEKLGRDEVGKWKWKKLSWDERYQIAHEAVRDPTRYEECLQATNFDKFLAVLSLTIGGSDVQLQLIHKQLKVAVQSLSADKDIAAQIRSIYDKRRVLGKPVDSLKKSFWDTYAKCEDGAFEGLKGPGDVSCLLHPVDNLASYLTLVRHIGWDVEVPKIEDKLKRLVRRQISVIFSEEHFARTTSWKLSTPAPIPLTWQGLSPESWKAIVRSILLVACHPQFYRCFGPEKILLESLVDKIVRTSPCYIFGKKSGPPDHYQNQHCSCGNAADVLSFQMQGSNLVATNEGKFKSVFQITVPQTLDDASHWGYVSWKACCIFESIAAAV